MRQGQQNRRGRNRSCGRKPQSALTRNFESNGPNVKIRGTASHIAEKYLALARDALSTGDIIVAESYFQHAEHYNRIIMAAQAEKQNGAEQRPAQPGANGRDHGGEIDLDGADEEPAPAGDSAAQAETPAEAEQPQTNRRRKSGNGAGTSESKTDGNAGEGQKSSRGAQARRKRQKVESTGARQKGAKAANGADGAGSNGASATPDDSASEGYSA